MTTNKIDKYLNVMTILLAIGLVCIIAGTYFIINNLTSSGVTMGDVGNQGTGTIDGKGMIFCGIIIGGFGLIFRDDKKEVDEGK